MAGDTGRSGSVYGGVVEPCTVVLFGASGDLAKRKVIPAMYDLAIHNALGPRYAILGFARTPMAEDAFRTTLTDAAKSISEVGPIDPQHWDEFASNLYYDPGDYSDSEAYAQLAKRLAELESAKNLGGNRLFYLSTPPEVYPDIVEQLGRGGFYETAGALRDMIQSHVLQLTSLVAVEPPASFDATAVRNEKLKVLQSIRPFDLEMVAQAVVRGQYAPGKIGDKPVPGYREEPNVNPASKTATFVACKLLIDNCRWAVVPFYLRTVNRLAKPSTEIMSQFACAPHIVFREREIEPNRLVLNIQPDEGISVSFGAKRPGTEMRLGNVNINFFYLESFAHSSITPSPPLFLASSLATP